MEENKENGWMTKINNGEGVISLETLLGAFTSLGIAYAHSYTWYMLMDKAGFYEFNSKGEMARLMTVDGIFTQIMAAAGTFALFLGGLYIGSDLGKELDGPDEQYKKFDE